MKRHIVKNNNGYTLIEVLITMSIIAILCTFAVVSYVGTTLKAVRSEAYANLEGLRMLESQLVAETGAYAVSTGTCLPDFPGNVALIQGVLPGFQPGTGLNFSYCIQMDVDISGAATPDPCFLAQAFGNANSRAAGDVFAIDCNNNRTF